MEYGVHDRELKLVPVFLHNPSYVQDSHTPLLEGSRRACKGNMTVIPNFGA